LKEKKLIPKRRFEEFTEEWESSKLRELADFSKGRGYSKKDLTSSGNPIILYGQLYTNYQVYISTVKTFAVRQENSVISNGEEVIIPSSGETIKDIARAAVVGKPGIILGSDLNIVKPRLLLNSLFLALNISGGNQQRELSKRAQGKPVVHLYNSDIEKVSINYPNTKEQQKIGEFFKHLDQMISLEQRKLEKIKALKSAYLAEMFPGEGERVPKRRFAGFTGEWKEYILDDVAIYRRGSFPQPYGKKKWYDEVNGMPFVQVVDVGENLKLVDNTKQKISKLAQPNSVFVGKGKILVTLQGSIGRVAITQYSSYIDRTLLLFESYKLPIDKICFAYIVQRLFEIEKLKAPGGTIKTITKEALSAFIVLLPNVKEQQAIGEFFKKSDESITNQQQKLNKLKAMKQAYLQEMFV